MPQGIIFTISAYGISVLWEQLLGLEAVVMLGMNLNTHRLGTLKLAETLREL